jgi:hypothetical protein
MATKKKCRHPKNKRTLIMVELRNYTLRQAVKGVVAEWCDCGALYECATKKWRYPEAKP